MNKKTKIILFAAIAVLIAGMALFPTIRALFAKDPQALDKPGKAIGNSQKRPALNVNVKVLQYEALQDIFRTKGLLMPDEEVDLSFETSGKIVKIYFREGSNVRKGELLAKVNDSPLQAELKKLEAQLPLANDRVFRQKSLLAKDAVSQEAYESVTTELEKLNADIELVKARIAQTELRAPFDGVVGLRQVSEGAYASPSLEISTLTKLSPLKIEFSVNERQANDIKPGTKITFEIENDLNVYEAPVYAVESKLDEKTLSLKARALYQNPGGKLKPGRSANISIQLSEISKAIVIPAISSIAEMGRDIVYVYKSGKAHLVEVKKGMRTASSVQVIDGLQPGDTLIVSGVMQLRDGMDVVINKAKE
ncbi:MAG: efflux RND transporter periplasmic adaptor subunit [Paludibacteraceae bacterium]|nr:efflux RND transporter periplasmic adaptor subunit [Paludibacteraceae bacterium]